MSEEIKENKETKKPTREEFETMLREAMEKQFQRGMYTAAYGVTGAVHDMIEKFQKKPRKRLVDYQSVLAEIDKLCIMNVKNPDKNEKEN